MAQNHKNVHLVLGSGGARGLAHIGVIEKLEQAGYTIKEVIGCSMGAVVGGIYCAGHLDTYKRWLQQLTRADVFDLMDFTFTSQGFVKGEKIFSKILELTGEQRIEDFEIPFTAVATNLRNMEEVHFSEGDLFKALRASISIPGIFVPIYEEDDILVDGGVLNPLPVNLVKNRRDALVIAVNVNGFVSPSPPQEREQTLEETDADDELNWFEKTFHLPDKFPSRKPNRLSLFELMDTSYNYTQDRLTQLMIEVHRPDIVVEIPRNAAGMFDFHETGKMIEMGALKLDEALQANNSKVNRIAHKK